VSEAPRRRLVDELERRRLIRSPRVREAFLLVPRELFVPDAELQRVYRDEAIVTKVDGGGVALSSSSQPAIMALMLEALDVRPGQRVLEIGAGTGYNAALLSVLVGPRGRVVTVDIDPEVARRARRALAAGGYAARVVVGDGREGWARGAPYDRIVVTASAVEVPRGWFAQLAHEGLVEAPIQLRGEGAVQAIPLLRRDREGFRSISVLCGGFMPLRDQADRAPGGRAMVSASSLVDGETEQMTCLFGTGVRHLSPSARTRALARLLEAPRRRALRVRRRLEGLHLYASLRIPERRLVSSPVGLGQISSDGRSLALLAWGGGLRAYGDDRAERALLTLVDEWKRRGRPTEEALDVRVRFTNGASTLRYRFRAG
jgi:protein-L-isoaspartate(D-aspartate) O-methyltransferase